MNYRVQSIFQAASLLVAGGFVAIGLLRLIPTATAEEPNQPPTEYQSGIAWEMPAVIDPGRPPGESPVPSDAIVLFGGTNLDAWESQSGNAAALWPVHAGGTTSPVGGGIRTKRSFGDIQLHVEWMTPQGETRTGQGNGNSGVFLMGEFEVQVLNSFENETYHDGQAGAIYKQSPPLVNASRAPGQWQSYDIIFEHPHFDEAGELIEPAYLTVLHNGVLIQNRVVLKGATLWSAPPHYRSTAESGPIALQDHGNAVKYRNIWVRELKLDASSRVEAKPPPPLD